MLDLKPCPHCGGKAHFDHDDDGWNWIECADCGASTNARVSAMDDCKPLLAEQWNRRHTPAGVALPRAVNPPEFQEVSYGVDSVMRPCKGMAISEYAFRQWAKDVGIVLTAGVALPPTDQQRREAENAAFQEWWDANQVDPLHTMIVKNAAHAAWQERATRGVSGKGGETFRGEPPMEPPSGFDRANALLRQAREALDDLKTAHWEHWPWQDIDLANAAIAAIDAHMEPK